MEMKIFAECLNIVDVLVLSKSGRDSGVCLEFSEI